MHLLTAKGAPRLQVCINAVELAIIANSIALDTVLKAACTRKSALQLITPLLFTFFFSSCRNASLAGGFAGRCVFWFFYFDLPAHMDQLCPCTNVFSTAYAHGRIEP